MHSPHFLFPRRGPFHFKLKGKGLLNFRSGCGFGGDKDNTLHLNPERRVDKLSVSFKDVFGEVPKKELTPLSPNDHPELDSSELLEDEDVEKHLSLTGQLQWAVTLGRWDTQTAVMPSVDLQKLAELPTKMWWTTWPSLDATNASAHLESSLMRQDLSNSLLLQTILRQNGSTNPTLITHCNPQKQNTP